MTRLLYRSLLRLHPGAFRRRFGPEMLCIFDEVAAGGTTAALLTDALVSLARQWLLRSGSWKAAAALLGAFLQVTAGGLGFLSMRPQFVPSRAGSAVTEIPPDIRDVILLSLWTTGSIILLVILTTLWVRSFTLGTGRR